MADGWERGPAELPRGGVVLGSFDLESLVGEGAMARVWRGRHRRTAIPVAIKVMDADATRLVGYQRAFQSELEAIARLDHPNIVSVYDYGDVPEPVARASAGALPAGSPYLVMELVEGMALGAVDSLGNWSELEHVLSALLDALAHAHARQVTHRDLKPANVLVSNDGRVLLTDFGLAHAKADANPVDYASWAASGTPPYMAPEQFRGQWRDQGPWTDLYALGCVAYSLAAGRPPFNDDELLQLANAHLTAPPPPHVARFDLPHGFEGWLGALLCKRPEDRFTRAADARYALAQLSSRMRDDATHVERIVEEDTTSVIGDDPTMESMTGEVSVLPSTPKPTGLGTIPILDPAIVRASRAVRSTDAATLVERSVAPMPDNWRRDDRPTGQARLGAGLGLFGLRSPPLVDRDDERERLWSTLRRVFVERSPRAVVIRGAAGNGKTRLVQWIGERAHEVGAANILRAHYTSMGGSADGIEPMLARYFRVQGLTAEAMRTHVEQCLLRHGSTEPYLADAICAELSENLQAVGEPVRKADDRLRVVLRAIEGLAQLRPVMIHLDDAQWGQQAIRLTRTILLESRDEAPIMVVLTVRDEALVAGSPQAEALDTLMSMTDVEGIELTKLPEADHRRLVDELLGHPDEALVDRVVTRTRGNPLFAVQLIEDWIDRNLLRSEEAGVTLQRRGSDTLPDDIHALCEARIARALGGRPAADQTALELAALLGGTIDELEWRAVCDTAHSKPSANLLDALSRQGLLEPSLGTWRFAHGVVQESLCRFIAAEGRWQRHHRVIAETLRAVHQERTAEVSERIAYHLVEAGMLQDAPPPLLRAARLRRIEGEYEQAQAALANRDGLMDRLRIPAEDPRRAEGDLLSVRLDLDRGRADAAERLATLVAERARAHRWPSLEARAQLRLGDVAAMRTDYEPAITHYGQALAAAIALGDRRAEIEARAGVAEVHYYRGDRQRAHDAYAENLTAAVRLGDELLIADAHWGLGYVALWRGDHDQAHHHFEQMRELLTRRGGAFRLADAFNALGEVARLRDRLAEAERCYVEALRLNEAYGTRGGLVNRLNIVLLRLSQDTPEALEPRISLLLTEATRVDHHGVMGSLLCNQLWVLAKLERWSRWDESLHQLEALLERWGITDGDFATGLTRAVETVVALGQPERAARV
ncbi:MAG: protein kinase, partial [Polyangiaceae bacterium]